MVAMGWRWHDEYPGVKANVFPSGSPYRLRDGFDRNLHFTKNANAAFYKENVKVPIGKWVTRERRVNYWMRDDSATGSGLRVRKSGWLGREHVAPTNILRVSQAVRGLKHPCPYSEQPTFSFDCSRNWVNLCLILSQGQARRQWSQSWSGVHWLRAQPSLLQKSAAPRG